MHMHCVTVGNMVPMNYCVHVHYNMMVLRSWENTFSFHPLPSYLFFCSHIFILELLIHNIVSISHHFNKHEYGIKSTKTILHTTIISFHFISSQTHKFKLNTLGMGDRKKRRENNAKPPSTKLFAYIHSACAAFTFCSLVCVFSCTLSVHHSVLLRTICRAK